MASDRAADDNFGYAVAINGSDVIVGAYQQDLDAAGGNSVTNAGAVYTYSRSGTTWSQPQKMVVAAAAPWDRFLRQDSFG